MRKSLGDWLAVVWHAVIGFIGGWTALAGPIILTRLQDSVSAGVPLNANAIEATVLSAVIGGILGAAYKWVDTSNNALLKSTVENNITPAQLDGITSTVVQKLMDAKPTSGVSTKTGLFLLGFMLLGSGLMAQTVENTGWGINPNFVGPAQFVSTSNGFVLLPNAGLAVEIGWEDVLSSGGINALQKSVGLVFEENFGIAENASTVNNAVLGAGVDYKGVELVIGFQVMGPSLGGPGSNGFIMGASYSLDSLIPFGIVFN